MKLPQIGHHQTQGLGAAMESIRIILAGLWIALMLVYLLGDVLRIFSGDFSTPGVIEGQRVTQAMWMGIAVLMLVPIVMLLVSLIVPYPAVRWLNLIAAGGLFIFNLLGLPTYPSAYDKFLIIVGLVFNLMTVYYAWNWAQAA